MSTGQNFLTLFFKDNGYVFNFFASEIESVLVLAYQEKKNQETILYFLKGAQIEIHQNSPCQNYGKQFV